MSEIDFTAFKEASIFQDINTVIEALRSAQLGERATEDDVISFCAEAGSDDALFAFITFAKNKSKELRCLNTLVEAAIEQLEYRVSLVETIMLINEQQAQHTIVESF